MIPQRLQNEPMQDYFKRTLLEYGATCDESGMWTIPPGSQCSGLYLSWVLMSYHKNILKRNQY